MEMKEIEIQYFFCNTTEGKVLQDMVCGNIDNGSQSVLRDLEAIENFGYSFKILPPQSAFGKTSAYNLLEAAFGNRIVIVDGSLDREVKNSKNFGQNYECLTPAAMSLDNVLLVSRTQIPLNFLPTRSNVKRIGDIEDGEWSENIVGFDRNVWKRGYELAYTNEQIVEWLKYELGPERMAKSYEDPKGQLRCRLNRHEDLRINLKLPVVELFKKEKEVIEENRRFLRDEQLYLKKERTVKCFISYRGCYYSRKTYKTDGYWLEGNDEYESSSKKEYGINDIIKIIEEKHKKEHRKAEIKVIPEGALSNEFMTEVRRWSFVSYIDRIIRDCDEFWIFNTHYKEDKIDRNSGVNMGEQSYWDSWWCQCEILTVLQMKKLGYLHDNFKVYIFDPETYDGQQINDVDISKWHDITTQESHELARYYANSDFFEAGFDSVPQMRRMRKFPKFLRKIMFTIQRSIYSQLYPEMKDEKYSFEDFNTSLYSHVYDKSFYEDRIYTCAQCVKCGRTEEIVKKNDFVLNILNINGWYTDQEGWETCQPVPGFFTMKKKIFDKITKAVGNIGEGFVKEGGGFRHPREKHLSFIYETEDEFYIWWVLRKGKRTGPNDSVVERVRLYRNVL